MNSKIRATLQPNLTIEWWGRRAVFEIVEEINDVIFWLTVLGIFLLSLPAMSTYFWYGVVIIVIMVLLYGWVEVEQWLHEVYVVCRDDSGGGMIYKFSGITTLKHIETPITKSSPTITTEYGLFYRLWAWITGEEMMRVYLKTDTHAFIEGQKISPKFYRAISNVRGAKKKAEDVPPLWHNIDGINRVYTTGLLPKEEAQHYIRGILNKEL